MIQYEFESLAGYEVSVEDYDNIIEPMYMALPNVSKLEFVKLINKERFALKPLSELRKEMRKIAHHLKETCTHYTDYDAKNELTRLCEEYQKRTHSKGYYINDDMIFSCYYPTMIEFYNSDYQTTIEIIL